jgi:hypothetical protein
MNSAKIGKNAKCNPATNTVGSKNPSPQSKMMKEENGNRRENLKEYTT